MLAFTMQFSRYGRNKGLQGASALFQPQPFRVSPAKRLLPQDPTACSPSRQSRAPVPQSHTGERTSRAFAHELSE